MAFVCSRLLGNPHPALRLARVCRTGIGSAALFLGLTACEATPDGEAPLPSDITLESNDNYEVTIGLAIPELGIDPAAPYVDWGGIVDNLRGETITPGAITLLTLARFDGKPQTEITQRLETGEGVSSIASAAGKLVPSGGATNASLVAFESTTITYEGLIPVPDFFQVPGTYLLSFATGMEQGQGTQAIVYLTPQAGATSETSPLLIPTGSAQLSVYAPVLKAPVEVPANTGPGVIGWANVQKDGLGMVIGSGFSKINRVFLAFHEGKTPASFNTKETFLRLEPDATRLWQATLSQPPDGQLAVRSIDLAQLSTATGEAFREFDLAPGAWIFAAMCDNCNNPAVIVTALQPKAN
jgi:hypothetical protein